ncbi:hypothetical protein ACFRAO_34230 [Streptomyces sp. NPDC056656]|uniref:hypothetical protein n=1 Tax=Streptomyces sp. NPDC056656 TaxID=3345895 RepID=UPI0036AA353A
MVESVKRTAGAATMRDLRGDQLPAWMDRVTQDELPALHSLVNGLRRDLDAVTAALSSPGVPAKSRDMSRASSSSSGWGSAEPTSTCSCRRILLAT